MSKEKIIITIGDEGAIIVHIDGDKMLKRLYASSPLAPELSAYLTTMQDVPVYALIDVVDQAYIHHKVPPVSSSQAKRLALRELNKQFSEEDLKTFIPLGREKEGKKGWSFLLIGVRNVNPFSEWINMISELPNHFAGIYLWPIESMHLLKKMQQITKIETSGSSLRWQILVSHQRVGGFRQVVYKNNKIVFTRIAQPIGSQTPDVIAGNIEQETLNTIEYIRRLGYKDEWGLDIFIIASEDVKQLLEVNNFPSSSLSIVAPHELAIKTNFASTAEEKDRFGDVVTAVFIATQKSFIKKLHTAYTKKLEQLETFSKAIKYTSILVAIICIVLAGLDVNNILSRSGERERLEKSRQAIQTKLSNLKNQKLNLEHNREGVIKTIEAYDKYTKDSMIMAESIAKIKLFKTDDFLIESVIANVSKRAEKRKILNSIILKFDVKVLHSYFGGMEEVVEKVDSLVLSIKEHFADYKINFIGLPDENSLTLEDNQNEEQNEYTSFNFTIKKQIDN